MLIYRVAPIFALMLFCACSIQPIRQSDLNSDYLQAQGYLAKCAGLFAQADNIVRNANATDAQTSRLPGFPYLRSSRFLASFLYELDEPQKLLVWMNEMRGLDKQARAYELKNASVELSGFMDEPDLMAELDSCAESMMQEDIEYPEQLASIKRAAKVADSYITANRIAGVYPISSWFVKRGINRLQKNIKRTFSSAVKPSIASGALETYAPKEVPAIGEEEISQLLMAGTANTLAMPSFNKQDKETLFSYFAPVWELDQVSEDDHIGSPYWLANQKLGINISDSVVYQYLSYTRLDGQVLPQFNYIIWFPARPAASGVDILAGHLDGITWRVTVSTDGNILMYDSMHNCGCYHMFFPISETGVSRLTQSSGEESILVPQQVAMLQTGQRVHLRIASGSHYIEAVTNKPVNSRHNTYRFADYNELRSLARIDGKHLSMFGINGIVPGTSRKERWLLWPMGVEDAGAMRQWGHHATAFIGRRHFDDADLLERYFSFPQAGQLEK